LTPGRYHDFVLEAVAEPPIVTPEETIDDIVARSGRRGSAFQLRRSFLQVPNESGTGTTPGPMSGLVSAGDLRGLQLYLILLTKASAEPWDAALPAPVWARALGLPDPTSKTATSTISKAWMRLERRSLVVRQRARRMAKVTLLCEEGSGLPYTSPGARRESYLQVPTALWTKADSTDTRWYRALTLPELAVLLIARSHGDNFRLPYEDAAKWYGISADSIARGLRGLQRRGLLDVTKTYKKAPLSPVGYTAELRYTLQDPLGPVGKLSSSSPRRNRVVTS
jgi:hypothetical protein